MVRPLCAVIGAQETSRLGYIDDISEIELHADAARRALADCGLGIKDIDGMASAAASPIAVANYLGIKPEYLDSTWIGGCSFVSHLRHAAAAIAAGMCTTVLITHGESGRSHVAPFHRAEIDPASIQGQFEIPYGTTGPTSLFPIGILRYMKDFGLSHEQLATVAVVQRLWAQGNERAQLRTPTTVEEVLAARMISYPLRRPQCCLLNDGGGAIVVVSPQRAMSMDLQSDPVFVLGTGEGSETPLISMMEDFTTSAAFRTAGRLAFAQSGLRHADIDHLMIYDAFAHLPVYGLEDLGFVGRGEAGAFIEEGNTAPGGRLPLNTNGGGLSYAHTGMYGMFLMQECIRQMRGDADMQIEGAEVSMGLAVGGMFNAASAVIFGTAAVAGL
jgi:acetyl-CoA acetyltransferase